MAGTAPEPTEELPYRVELWRVDGTDTVERVLGRALNVQLAHAIFKAAKDEHPQRRITLREGSRVIADSSAEAGGSAQATIVPGTISNN